MTTYYCILPERALIHITGKDSASFLQGLLTQDVTQITQNQAHYALMLTPQGKILYDFFLYCLTGYEGIMIECPAKNVTEIIQKMQLYTLRSQVEITHFPTGYHIVAVIGNTVSPMKPLVMGKKKNASVSGTIWADPRAPELLGRGILWDQEEACAELEKAGLHSASADLYEQERIKAGLAEGEKDFFPNQSFPLHFGLHHHHAIDFKKGCYVGQEVTARMYYRGGMHKQIFRITTRDQPCPPQGTVIYAEGKKIGVMCSSSANNGLALLDTRTEASWHTQPLSFENNDQKAWVVLS